MVTSKHKNQKNLLEWVWLKQTTQPPDLHRWDETPGGLSITKLVLTSKSHEADRKQAKEHTHGLTSWQLSQRGCLKHYNPMEGRAFPGWRVDTTLRVGSGPHSQLNLCLWNGCHQYELCFAHSTPRRPGYLLGMRPGLGRVETADAKNISVKVSAVSTVFIPGLCFLALWLSFTIWIGQV